tara:strand:+ start:399 stop:572 length:174 start_codon:yes stop_codon:yes gene_type:complete
MFVMTPKKFSSGTKGPTISIRSPTLAVTSILLFFILAAARSNKSSFLKEFFVTLTVT